MLTLEHRLALECLAVGDGLRNVRQVVAQMVHDNDPAVTGRPETAPVLVHGLDVADALVKIAAALASAPQPLPEEPTP